MHCHTVQRQAENGSAFPLWRTEQHRNRGAQEITAPIAATTESGTTKAERTLYTWHQRVWPANWVSPIAGASIGAGKALTSTGEAH